MSTEETVIWGLAPGETNPAYEGVIYGAGRLLSPGDVDAITAAAGAVGYHTFRVRIFNAATGAWRDPS
jgi:hypothetical protein